MNLGDLTPYLTFASYGLKTTSKTPLGRQYPKWWLQECHFNATNLAGGPLNTW
jgi:hypothetical protein